MSLSLPKIYTCSDKISGVDFVDIDYTVLNLTSLPAINANTSENVNVFISNKTRKTARINFSQKIFGTVYYTVMGFN
tara:strand:- start:79 stop:309 length:231 start_codon:yes stop_codon:yes gene_type:complete